MVGAEPLTHLEGMENNDTPRTEARLEVWSPAFVMTAILTLFMLTLAVFALLAPHGAAVGFGIPVIHPNDLFYVRVKGDRDLSTALALMASCGCAVRCRWRFSSAPRSWSRCSIT